MSALPRDRTLAAEDMMRFPEPGPILEKTISTDDQGLSTIKLTYKINSKDRDPKRIILRMHRRLGDAVTERVPAFYALQEQPGSAPSLAPTIVLIVGPGVSIDLHGFKQNSTENVETPRLAIHRVQNPRQIPPAGSPFSLATLTSSYFIDLTVDSDGNSRSDPSTEPFDSRAVSEQVLNRYSFSRVITSMVTQGTRRAVPADGQPDAHHFTRYAPSAPDTVDIYDYPRGYIEVFRLPDGVVFKHPHSRQTLLLKVPQFANPDAPAQQSDFNARYAYRIDTSAIKSGPIVRIVKTGKVTAHLASTRPLPLNGRPDPKLFDVFWEMHETDDFNKIPPQGAPVELRGLGWRQSRLSRIPAWWEVPYMAFVDIGTGFIPVIGDIADWGEFALALTTDRDKWGRRVSTTEKVIMGIAVLLPLASSGAARRLVRQVGRRSEAAPRALESAQRALASIENMQLDSGEQRFILETSERLTAGKALSRAQIRRANEIARKVPPCRA